MSGHVHWNQTEPRRNHPTAPIYKPFRADCPVCGCRTSHRLTYQHTHAQGVEERAICLTCETVHDLKERERR